MKHLECVKSYVDSKWETILDWIVMREEYDFLLELIVSYEIPKEKYLNHKGENSILLVDFQMYQTFHTFRRAYDGDGVSKWSC